MSGACAVLRLDRVVPMAAAPVVDGFHHLADGVVDHCILERREANRPYLALALGEVDPLAGLMAMPLGLQPCVPILEVRLHALAVWLLCDPIHAHRRRGTLATIGPCERRHIKQMRQGVAPSCEYALRSCHSLHTSW
jgi:hypothetical protein